MSKSIPPLKQCAYPSCEKTIGRRSTYCVAHAPRPRPSPETIKLRAEKLRGKKRSVEIRSQMSLSAKKRANTPEGKLRMSKAAKAQTVNAFKGRTHTEETKEIIRQKRAKQVFSEESIKKGVLSRKGRPNLKNRGRVVSEEENARRSQTLRSKREHLSQKAKERYLREDEAQREKRLTNWIKAGQDNIPKMSHLTSIEIFIAQYLDAQGIAYEQQRRISYYIVDFYVPSKSLVIEAMGCYWHGCKQCGFNDEYHVIKRQKDDIRTERLKKKGYAVIALWEHDIRKSMQDGTPILQLDF